VLILRTRGVILGKYCIIFHPEVDVLYEEKNVYLRLDKVVGIEGLSNRSRGGTMGDRGATVMVVRKSPPLA
jgi:hypothetical protein